MSKPKLTVRELREILPHMPFNSLLGFHIARVYKDGLTIDCTVRPNLLNGYGTLHGGVLASLVDAAAGIALLWHFGGRTPVTTVELKVNYFRPVVEGKVYARAHVLRTGSSICVSRVDVRDAHKRLVGTALVTYMVLPPR